MTLHAVELDTKPVHRSFRLTRPGGGDELAVQSQVRPALVLPEREGRALLAAAQRQDVSRGGVFSAGPAGVQVWSAPWEGPLGTKGDSRHLGSVDWSYDTPSRHYITIYRVLVTGNGLQAGVTTMTLTEQVLALIGLSGEGERASLAAPPARDPFRRGASRTD